MILLDTRNWGSWDLLGEWPPQLLTAHLKRRERDLLTRSRETRGAWSANKRPQPQGAMTLVCRGRDSVGAMATKGPASQTGRLLDEIVRCA